MNTIGNKFLVRQEKAAKVAGSSNYIDENFLFIQHPNAIKDFEDLSARAPHYVSTSVGSLSEKTNAFSAYLKTMGQVMETCKLKLRWMIKTMDGHAYAVSVKNLNEGVECVGIEGAPFDILLDWDGFRDGDKLATSPQLRYQVLVVGEPQSAGTATRYTVQYLTDSPDDYFPGELLAENLKWCCMGSHIGEASVRGGSVNWNENGDSYLIYEVPTSQVRKTVKVTDRADLLAKEAYMEISKYKMSGDGKYREDKDFPRQLFPYVIAKLQASIEMEKELALIYGRAFCRNVVDSSTGYPMSGAPGVYEFLEDSNVFEYNPETDSIDIIIEYLQEIFFDRVPYDQRHVEIIGGQKAIEWLISEFHIKWGTAALPHIGDSNYGLRPRTDGKKSLSFGGNKYNELETPTAYITRYMLFPGGSVTFRHMPVFDSYTYANGLEYNGYPASSWEMMILDYGIDPGVDSNVVLTECSKFKGYNLRCGTWSPAGFIANGSSYKGFASTDDEMSYRVTQIDQFGLVIKDVSTMALIRPVFN